MIFTFEICVGTLPTCDWQKINMNFVLLVYPTRIKPLEQTETAS